MDTIELPVPSQELLTSLRAELEVQPTNHDELVAKLFKSSKALGKTVLSRLHSADLSELSETEVIHLVIREIAFVYSALERSAEVAHFLEQFGDLDAILDDDFSAQQSSNETVAE